MALFYYIIGVCGFSIHVGKNSYLCTWKNNSVMPKLNIIRPPKISVTSMSEIDAQLDSLKGR